MASTKRLRKAALKFRKNYSYLHAACSTVLDKMGNFIRKAGATEVTGTLHFNTGVIECHADE